MPGKWSFCYVPGAPTLDLTVDEKVLLEKETGSQDIDFRTVNLNRFSMEKDLHDFLEIAKSNKEQLKKRRLPNMLNACCITWYIKGCDPNVLLDK